MEITEEIKTKEADEKLSKKEQDDLFYTLLSGKTVKETIKTTRGDFVVKFPKQKDFLKMDKLVAIMRGNLAADSFDRTANFTMQKIAFLDVVIESGEKWFNNLKKENFSWGDMPDTDFVDEVYVLAWSFRSKVQEKLRGIEGEADSGDSKPEDISEDVGDGLFSGVTGTTKKD